MSNWQGTTVPNTGHVEKVYFNTNLSIDEVTNLLSQLNYTTDEDGVYSLFCNADDSVHYVVFNRGTFIVDLVMFMKVINGELPEDYMLKSVVWMDGSGDPFTGWNPDFNGVVSVNSELISRSLNYTFDIGVQNNLLTSLISITPFSQAETETKRDWLKELFIGEAKAALNSKSACSNTEVLMSMETRIAALESGDSSSGANSGTKHLGTFTDFFFEESNDYLADVTEAGVYTFIQHQEGFKTTPYILVVNNYVGYIYQTVFTNITFTDRFVQTRYKKAGDTKWTYETQQVFAYKSDIAA